MQSSHPQPRVLVQIGAQHFFYPSCLRPFLSQYELTNSDWRASCRELVTFIGASDKSPAMTALLRPTVSCSPDLHDSIGASIPFFCDETCTPARSWPISRSPHMSSCKGSLPHFLESYRTRLAVVQCMSFGICVAANFGLAIQNRCASLLLLRMLQSLGASATVAIGYGLVADIANPAERGRVLGPAMVGKYIH